jgi:transcriptional regulator with XRE-family HTH domain
MLVGIYLRRLREARGISRADAGYKIRSSESKMSRLERGRVGFKDRDVDDLLTLYGVTEEADRAPILALVREGNQHGWWHRSADVLPDWFELYLGLEMAATLIRTYEVQFIPGLLQTEDYARALITQNSTGSAVSAQDIDRWVGVRMQRQEILTRPEDPARLWAVLDEAVLRRRIGTPAVMHAQVEHLIALSRRPNLVIQVMPWVFGGHVAESGAFSILRFGEPDLSDVVYLEYLTDAVYVDKPSDVDPYTEIMNRLNVDSMPPDESTDFLTTILAGMK